MDTLSSSSQWSVGADDSTVTATGIGGDWMAVNAIPADNTSPDIQISATVQATAEGSAQTEFKIGFYPWYKDANNYVVAWVSTRTNTNYNEVVLTGKVNGAAIDPEWRGNALSSSFDITKQHTFTVRKTGTQFSFYLDGSLVTATSVDGTAAAGYGLNVYNVDAVYTGLTFSSLDDTFGWSFSSDGWSASSQPNVTINGIGGTWMNVNATRLDNSFGNYQLTATVQASAADNVNSEHKIGFYPWYKDASNNVVAWITTQRGEIVE